MTGQSQTAVKQFTGKHMVMVMLAFFGVIIGVNIFMAVLATKSWTGLVVPNSYVASQHYNEELAKARLQSELGWTSRLSYSGDALRLSIRNTEGENVGGISVAATLSVPAHEHRDHDVLFMQGDDGSYSTAAQLEPGQWRANVNAVGADGQTYRQVFRFVVKSEP